MIHFYTMFFVLHNTMHYFFMAFVDPSKISIFFFFWASTELSKMWKSKHRLRFVLFAHLETPKYTSHFLFRWIFSSIYDCARSYITITSSRCSQPRNVWWNIHWSSLCKYLPFSSTWNYTLHFWWKHIFQNNFLIKSK